MAQPNPSRSRHGIWSPLSVAAYVTWAAIAVEPAYWWLSVRQGPVGTGRLLALVAFLGVLALFVLGAMWREQDGRRGHVNVLAQAALSLFAIAQFPGFSFPVLLVIVAAQLVGVTSLRRAIVDLLAINAIMAAIFFLSMPTLAAAITLLAYGGFQTFAAVTGLYARRAEEARDELERVNAHLFATRALLEETTRSEERLRLSRELHDVAGHKLTALKLNLQRARREPLLAEREDLGAVGALADELLQDIRAVVGELRRHDGVDLQRALQALTRHIRSPRIHLDLADDARVDDVQTAEALMRCAQEALTNALRHSRASDVWLSLRRSADGVRLEVRDNGRGAPTLDFGNGLTGMRERLHGLGGRLDVRSVLGQGLTVLADIPLRTAT
jgi:signal transduction histidine kinase